MSSFIRILMGCEKPKTIRARAREALLHGFDERLPRAEPPGLAGLERPRGRPSSRRPSDPSRSRNDPVLQTTVSTSGNARSARSS